MTHAKGSLKHEDVVRAMQSDLQGAAKSGGARTKEIFESTADTEEAEGGELIEDVFQAVADQV